MSKRNIALSGWSGAGTSTTTMCLALILQCPYYGITSVFREITRLLNLNKAGTVDDQLPEYENYLQTYVGKVVDQYVDDLLINAAGIILESDISAFRLGKRPEYYSIFLKTDLFIRSQRFILDQRTDKNPEELLKLRDHALQTEYLKLWNIDIFDEQLITQKFNFVLDNSQLDLQQTLEIIIQTLFQQLGFESLNDRSRLGLEAINVSQFNQILGTDGKQELCFQLQQAGLFITPQQIMSEITKQFTEEIGRWPRDLKTIFLSTQV